jgi:hypothetical protein
MNLMLALLHLRYPLHPRTLWIDAICINQSNTDEKNHQVSLMKKIYRRAHSVFAWLGPEGHDSSMVLEFADRIKLQQDLDERRHMVFWELRDKSYDFGRAYARVFQRSYWYRTWIIQEVFSAKQLFIQCGPLVVTWDSLVALHTLLINEYYGVKFPSGQIWESMDDLHFWVHRGPISRRRLGRYISSGERFLDLSRLRESRLRSPENTERRKLHKLLFENWDAVASDPCDKVFAILGLASDSNNYGIVVDYSLTVSEVYTTVVENYIRIYGNLFIILPRRFPQDQQHYLPTWCPDWSSPDTQRGSWKDAYPFQVAEYSRPYCAAGSGSQAIVRFSVRRQFMITRGWRLDTIKHRSKSNSNSIPPPYIEEKPSFWELPLVLFCLWLVHFCLCLPWSRSLRPSTTRQAPDFDIWYAMHRRKLYSSYIVSTRRHTVERNDADFIRYCRLKHQEFFLVLLRATNLFVDDRQAGRTAHAVDDWKKHGDIPKTLSSNLSEVMTPALQEIAESLGEIKINQNYACFFLTRSGFMGLGPRDMMDDDMICILRGCDFPVILRWDGFAFRLLGSCYVVGVMHGQFVRPEWQNRRKEEEFEIW